MITATLTVVTDEKHALEHLEYDFVHMFGLEGLENLSTQTTFHDLGENIQQMTILLEDKESLS